MLRYLAATFCAGAIALTLMSSASVANDDRCTIATKGPSPVADACRSGGVKAARRAMQALKKAAKKKGMSRVDCDDCHKDATNDNYTLAKDAPDRFKEMLKAAAEVGAQ